MREVAYIDKDYNPKVKKEDSNKMSNYYLYPSPSISYSICVPVKATTLPDKYKLTLVISLNKKEILAQLSALKISSNLI